MQNTEGCSVRHPVRAFPYSILLYSAALGPSTNSRRSPGWHCSSRHSAISVEKRMALALLFLRMDRFAGVMPTRSASSPAEILRFAIITSRFTRISMVRLLDREIQLRLHGDGLLEHVLDDAHDQRHEARCNADGCEGKIVDRADQADQPRPHTAPAYRAEKVDVVLVKDAPGLNVPQQPPELHQQDPRENAAQIDREHHEKGTLLRHMPQAGEPLDSPIAPDVQRQQQRGKHDHARLRQPHALIRIPVHRRHAPFAFCLHDSTEFIECQVKFIVYQYILIIKQETAIPLPLFLYVIAAGSRDSVCPES